ncbi:MAG: hypothetical protein JWN04_703 [Myxococcaceae bacterium]|nr:hypothetical protein [Myxococcaceae bacterium]
MIEAAREERHCAEHHQKLHEATLSGRGRHGRQGWRVGRVAASIGLLSSAGLRDARVVLQALSNGIPQRAKTLAGELQNVRARTRRANASVVASVMRYLLFCAVASASMPLAVRAQDASNAAQSPPTDWTDRPSDESQPSADDAERALLEMRAPVVSPAPPTPLQAAPSTIAQNTTQTAPGYAPSGAAPNAYSLIPTAPAPVATAAVPPSPAPGSTCPDGATPETADLPKGYSLAAGVLIKTPPQGAERIRYDALSEQLQQAQAQRDALPAPNRIRIGLPITGMLVGFGGAIAGAAVAHNAFTSARDISHGHMSRHDDINNDGQVNGRDQQRFRNIGYGLTAAAAVGALTGVIGSATLGKRLARRQTVQVERRTLGERIDALRRELDYGFNAGPQQLQLRLGGQF